MLHCVHYDCLSKTFHYFWWSIHFFVRNKKTHLISCRFFIPDAVYWSFLSRIEKTPSSVYYHKIKNNNYFKLSINQNSESWQDASFAIKNYSKTTIITCKICINIKRALLKNLVKQTWRSFCLIDRFKNWLKHASSFW